MSQRQLLGAMRRTGVDEGRAWTRDRPFEKVFAFLADGENDPRFSPRALEIARRSDGPRASGHLLERGQGCGRQEQARVQADSVRPANPDPLARALQELGDRS